MVLRGAGVAGAVNCGCPTVGSERISLGGGALRPRATAHGGTPGGVVPPNKAGVIITLPIAKASRKRRDLITVEVFMRREPERRKTPANGGGELVHSLGGGGVQRRSRKRLPPSLDRVKL